MAGRPWGACRDSGSRGEGGVSQAAVSLGRCRTQSCSYWLLDLRGKQDAGLAQGAGLDLSLGFAPGGQLFSDEFFGCPYSASMCHLC